MTVMSARWFTRCPIPGLLSFLLLPILLVGQERPRYFDGPYIFQGPDSIRLQWVERGVPYDTLIARGQATVFQRDSLPVVDLRNLNFAADNQVSYKDVSRITAISDVHGQYDLMRQLLQANQVIDQTGNWTYGDGHHVVVGDNFDRGDRVLDILWFLFQLEQKAAAAGGKVHVLLGNHELMVLQGDLRYLHKKYYYTSAAFITRYDQFFRTGSVLGDWIAQQKVVIKINDHLFVHGGISPALVQLGYSRKRINSTFRNQIVRQPAAVIDADPALALLYGSAGPLWYRGYFEQLSAEQEDSAGQEAVLSMEAVDQALKAFGVKSIVVGHTSQEDIQSLFDGKIIAIDCSIKLGQDGQVLVIEDNQFFTVDLDGEKLKIGQVDKVGKTSLFEYIYRQEGLPRMVIDTDLKQLIKIKNTETYLPATISLADTAGTVLLEAPARVRARGNIRKEVCYYPPMMIDFSKSVLDSLGLLRIDKLKVVVPCNTLEYQQHNLHKEFLAYQLYSVVDTNALEVKEVVVNLTDGTSEGKEFIGFLVEPEAAYAQRKDAVIITEGRVNPSVMDRPAFVKMQFFQYMIANTDWSLSNKHNLEIVKLSSMERPIALAYDFDYAGFVGQKYAVPHPDLPILSVNDRYFFAYPLTEEECDEAIAYYLSVEDQLYAVCDQATYLDEKIRNQNKRYLASFFDLLRNPTRLKQDIMR